MSEDCPSDIIIVATVSQQLQKMAGSTLLSNHIVIPAYHLENEGEKADVRCLMSDAMP